MKHITPNNCSMQLPDNKNRKTNLLGSADLKRIGGVNMEKVLSAKKACELLSTSRSTLWRLNKKNLLVARRLGGKVAYLQSEVEAFIAGLPPAGGIHCEQQSIKAENQINASALPRSVV
jgi:predicted DNA-binding transcriptional regulator AlpA